ncbi:putative amino acid ABC transporter LivHM family permease protein [Octadecabacter arcticus 238]|uniref:Putative amino acid ABC transporter LivHM family permease protein n=1 Tax=Octadecabacter arcticus 238 TaxID=391616 RepID=M9RIZ6_9RHOB|nr:branched-chain amino acid ABC transporter permease [Octadecabacter arcticus]AGI71753.1 putative amino acid ABC transporter LivHM family permease protein [Octadecabacter arcticus 238]
MSAYLISMTTYAGFFMILALALNLQWGLTGMVNFGIAGFYALGAYTSGLLSAKAGWPLGVTIPAAVLVGLVAGGLVALLSMRLREDFLAVVTLGVGEMIRLVLLNEDQITEGPRGLRIEAQPFRDMISVDSYPFFYLCLVALSVAVIFLICERIRKSPMGRTLRAIREDDVVAGVLGKNVFRHRVQIFALGGGFMGLAGALYAHYTQNISPEVFMPMVAMFIWMSVIVGGAGNNRGLLIGAGTVIMFLEGTRFIGDVAPWLDAEKMSSLRIITIGMLLIVTLRVRPRGLLPEPKFIYQKPKDAGKPVRSIT